MDSFESLLGLHECAESLGLRNNNETKKARLSFDLPEIKMLDILVRELAETCPADVPNLREYYNEYPQLLNDHIKIHLLDKYGDRIWGPQRRGHLLKAADGHAHYRQDLLYPDNKLEIHHLIYRWVFSRRKSQVHRRGRKAVVQRNLKPFHAVYSQSWKGAGASIQDPRTARRQSLNEAFADSDGDYDANGTSDSVIPSDTEDTIDVIPTRVPRDCQDERQVTKLSFGSLEGKASFAAEIDRAKEKSTIDKQREKTRLHIAYLRNSLQKGFSYNRSNPVNDRWRFPKDDQKAAMYECLQKLERYPQLDRDMIKETKIDKVIKGIADLESISGENDLLLKQISGDLLIKWRSLSSSHCPKPEPMATLSPSNFASGRKRSPGETSASPCKTQKTQHDALDAESSNNTFPGTLVAPVAQMLSAPVGQDRSPLADLSQPTQPISSETSSQHDPRRVTQSIEKTGGANESQARTMTTPFMAHTLPMTPPPTSPSDSGRSKAANGTSSTTSYLPEPHTFPNSGKAPSEAGDTQVEEGSMLVEEGSLPVEEGSGPLEQDSTPVEEGIAPIESDKSSVEGDPAEEPNNTSLTEASTSGKESNPVLETSNAPAESNISTEESCATQTSNGIQDDEAPANKLFMYGEESDSLDENEENEEILWIYFGDWLAIEFVRMHERLEQPYQSMEGLQDDCRKQERLDRLLVKLWNLTASSNEEVQGPLLNGRCNALEYFVDMRKLCREIFLEEYERAARAKWVEGLRVSATTNNRLRPLIVAWIKNGEGIAGGSLRLLMDVIIAVQGEEVPVAGVDILEKYIKTLFGKRKALSPLIF